MSAYPNTSCISQISNIPVRYLLIFLELPVQGVEEVAFREVLVRLLAPGYLLIPNFEHFHHIFASF